ncbi:MAG: L-threonylcarbamoyladenylate synthase [Lentimicrobiaceae bacterium]|nr:L-threonylcarbamoyladenylate synthase [Lentimicrobiaceae bacterium]
MINEEVIKACQFLKKGGVILYPTDTIWGLGCDAENAAAVNRIFAIKKRPLQKSFIILLDEIEKLPQYIDPIPEIAWDLIEKATRPTTFIYNNVKNLPPKLIAADGTIAIRIVQDEFCKKLINLLGRPLVSTSANITRTPTPMSFKEISQEIIQKADYVVDPTSVIVKDAKPSTMIRFIDDYSFEVVRE